MEICVEHSAGHVARQIGKSDNGVAAMIDSHRGVPAFSSEVAQINHLAIFPEQRMRRAERSHGSVASSGDADDLSIVIDRRGRSVRVRDSVRGKRWELCDRPHSGPIHDGQELQHLRQNTG